MGAWIVATALSASPGLLDTTPYRHLEYARQLRESGFTLRGHPFLPGTILGSSGVDLWWGFHLFLVPFTCLNNIWGARATAIFIAAVVTATLTLFIYRLGQRRAWIFALLPYALALDFVIRAAQARPEHLTIPLLLVDLFAGLGDIHWAWALISAVFHFELHLSWPLAPLFAGAGWCGARSAGERGSVPSIAATVVGMALALGLRPDRINFLQIAFVTDFGALGMRGVGRLPHSGAEMMPLSLHDAVRELMPALMLLAVSFVVGRGGRRAARVATQRALAFALAGSMVMALYSGRFIDYVVPLAAMLAAAIWPINTETTAPSHQRHVGLATVGLLMWAWLVARGIKHAWRLGTEYLDPPSTFEQMAAAVRSNVPPGTVLFTDDLFLTGVLYAYLPEYRYVIAYDPIILYGASPERFWRWHHAVVDGIDCAKPICGNVFPTPEAIMHVLRDFGTGWAITSYPRGRLSMQEVMGNAPGRFDLVDIAPGPVTGLYLWHSRSK